MRGRVVERIGRLVEANAEALARLVTARSASRWPRPAARCRRWSTPATFFVGEGRRLYGQTVPSEMPDKQLFTFRVPVGVAAIVTAGNFPVAVPSWYLVPALLCGNAVVWKPAEYTPAIAEAFTELFVRGGLPDGVLNTVLADGPATFDGLAAALDAGLVDKIGFTGSSAVGVRIGELAGRHLQNPCLELGGKNPLVVMPDADLDLAVEGALFSGFGTAGQRCTSLGTVIVHASVHDEFLAPLRRRGAGRGDRRPDPGRRAVRPDDLDAVPGRLRGAPGPGARRTTRCTGPPAPAGSPRTTRGTASSATPRPGVYAHPTIVDGVRPTTRSTGPRRSARSSGWPTFETFDEAVELANGHGYGLSAAIYTTTPVHAFRFRERVSAGMVSVNNSTSGAEAHLPFGGNGRSGNGSRQSGDLGARPVHPLAVDELGLRRQAAEGPDGHRRPARRPRLPPPLTSPSSPRRAPAERARAGLWWSGAALAAWLRGGAAEERWLLSSGPTASRS